MYKKAVPIWAAIFIGGDILLCRKCSREIPDDAVWCCYCGIKLVRDTLKAKKRANGMGCIKHLSGRRRKPWLVLVTKNGKQIPMGTYAKQTEAESALAKISPESISERYNYTVEKIYEEWKAVHFRNLTNWGEQGYKSAWTHYQTIKGLKMREVKTDTLQKCIDAATTKNLSRSVCEKMKQLASQLCKYAMQQDIITKNYAQFIVLPKEEKKEKEIFTDKEIDVLFAHDADKDVKIVLALIYTGFRIDELLSVETTNVHIEDGYMIGGEKTEAGKNRVVPINEKIMPYIKGWYAEAVKNKNQYLITNTQGKKMSPSNYRNRGFYKVLGDLGFQPHIDKAHPASKFARLTPHSTRHTFASLGVRAGVKPEVLQKLLGHAHYETTADIYIHENLDDLKSGMDLINNVTKNK